MHEADDAAYLRKSLADQEIKSKKNSERIDITWVNPNAHLKNWLKIMMSHTPLKHRIHFIYKDWFNDEFLHSQLQVPNSAEAVKNKAKLAFDHFKMPVMVDDNSFNLNEFQKKDYSMSIHSLGLLKTVLSLEDKSAYETCAFGFCASADSEPDVIQSTTHGRIVKPASWKEGDKDPEWSEMFQYNGFEKPRIEMTDNELVDTNERINAMRKLMRYFA